MLVSHSSLLLFVTGAAVLLVIPGPAVTYVVSGSIGHGRAAGLVPVLGIVVGTLCHVVAAALGISAVLASSALASICKVPGRGLLDVSGNKDLAHQRSAITGCTRGGNTPCADFWPRLSRQSAESENCAFLSGPFCRNSSIRRAATSRSKSNSESCSPCWAGAAIPSMR